MALVVEKLIKKMWLLLRMWFTDKCFFWDLQKYLFRRSLFMALTLSKVKFWEEMGEEISIHTAFFVWRFKIALPSFCGIPANASIIFSIFRATNSRSTDMKCKFVPSNMPQGFSRLILNLIWFYQLGW